MWQGLEILYSIEPIANRHAPTFEQPDSLQYSIHYTIKDIYMQVILIYD